MMTTPVTTRRALVAAALAGTMGLSACGGGPIPNPPAPELMTSAEVARRADSAREASASAAASAAVSAAAPVREPAKAVTPPAAVPPEAAPPAPAPIPAPPPLEREFRGVWVATVANMDWPSRRGMSTQEAQAELLALLDRAKALRLNAVIFQVRPAADALYASTLEPWSEYLTGTQGQKPEPFWDPLAFAVKEAHARGLELHAWFNPYRARFTGAKSPLARNHIARTHPALVKTYGGYLWMDPGEPAVRERTLRVVLDVVKRYDIDGVHIDDYFYPYPVTRKGKRVDFPDARSWEKYRASGGKLSRDDWRRENVNTLVRELHEGIHRTKPWVRFGVSPFGIWRPGYPESVRGFDAYESLYADARKWLREGWLDYLTPQLYWPTTRPAQSYPVLLDWWASENKYARHLWPGNFTSQAGARGSGAFPVSELMEQIRITRRNPGASGNVHFSMKSFMANQAGMNDTLLVGPYRTVAVPPATPWLNGVPKPVVPAPVLTAASNGWQLQLAPAAAPGTAAGTGAAPSTASSRAPSASSITASSASTPWQWVVRLQTDTAWVTMIVPGSTTRVPVARSLGARAVSVSALNRVGEEGPAVTLPITTRATGTGAGAGSRSGTSEPSGHQ